MRTSTLAMITVAFLAMSSLTPVMAQSSRGPSLLAVARHTPTPVFPDCQLAPNIAYIISYDAPVIGAVGTPIANVSGTEFLITAGEFAGQPFAQFDTISNANFNEFTSRLSDGIDDIIFTHSISFDSNGIITSRSNADGGPESGRLDADLAGENVDFARLVGCTDLGPVWQFWSGAPVTSGGGQQQDVDNFLTYESPLEKTTNVGFRTEVEVIINYGPTVDPLTFTATMNRDPVGGFNPIANTTEKVTIPLSELGRNTLVISISGVKSSGQTAKDTDRLTFINGF